MPRDTTVKLPSADIIITRPDALTIEALHAAGVEPALVFQGVDFRLKREHRERDTGPYTDPVWESRIIITTDWKEV